MRSILCATAALAALLATSDTANAETAAGCIKKNGQLVQLALADKPRRKCARKDREVVLSMHQPGRYMAFHEVLRFGETLTISDRPDGRAGRYLIEGGCGSSAERRGVNLDIYYSPAVMSIHDNGETVISGITEGRISASYGLPHMYEMAAKTGVVDLMDSNGDRLRVEAVLVVNHEDCVISGTVEEFTRP